ncbi:MAG: hypothetical protein FJW53_04635 [Actinobacteria bacterium]|nr:hypothetical protein [Actinomycetota bacterium]
MTITVTPETFHFVSFDAPHTARIAARVATMLGLDDIDIDIVVDETSPLARVFVDAAPDRIVVTAHSGALEDTKHPTNQSDRATTLALSRALLKARDRVRGGFADAPADSALELRQTAAWDVHIVARLSRLGMEINKQASLYNFRNRHGFADSVDGVFETIWSIEATTWSELDAFSARAATARA